jgi:hypothetical protein
MLLYFISFLLIVSFFVLNMFVGVVVENFHKCRQHQEAEEARRREEKQLRRLERRRRSKAAPMAVAGPYLCARCVAPGSLGLQPKPSGSAPCMGAPAEGLAGAGSHGAHRGRRQGLPKGSRKQMGPPQTLQDSRLRLGSREDCPHRPWVSPCGHSDVSLSFQALSPAQVPAPPCMPSPLLLP